MKELNQVTLCAVDGVNRGLAERAIDICNRHCRFAESILFSSQPGEDGPGFKSIHVPRLESLAAYTPFYMK